MLADPTFDGLDELRTTLADLKAKRDALAPRLKPAEQPAALAITGDDLRGWALAQFSRLHDLPTKATVELQDRQWSSRSCSASTSIRRPRPERSPYSPASNRPTAKVPHACPEGTEWHACACGRHEAS